MGQHDADWQAYYKHAADYYVENEIDHWNVLVETINKDFKQLKPALHCCNLEYEQKTVKDVITVGYAILDQETITV